MLKANLQGAEKKTDSPNHPFGRLFPRTTPFSAPLVRSDFKSRAIYCTCLSFCTMGFVNACGCLSIFVSSGCRVRFGFGWDYAGETYPRRRGMGGVVGAGRVCAEEGGGMLNLFGGLRCQPS